MDKWNVVQCWAPSGISLGQAMNTAKLLRFTGFEDKVQAENYLQRRKDQKEEDFHYWLEPIKDANS